MYRYLSSMEVVRPASVWQFHNFVFYYRLTVIDAGDEIAFISKSK